MLILGTYGCLDYRVVVNPVVSSTKTLTGYRESRMTLDCFVVFGRKEMTKDETFARSKLIEYLDFLLDRDHIACRPTLRRYRVKLSMNEFLSPKEFTHVLKFLERDVKRYSRKELRTLFRPIIRRRDEVLNTDTASTLDAFL